MALTLDEKIKLSNIRIEKAHINLKDAEDMFRQGKYGLTIEALAKVPKCCHSRRF